jgi:protein TonB
MTSRKPLCCTILSVLLLGGCAASTPPAPENPVVAAPQSAAAATSSLTLEGYKRDVAARIAARSPHMFTDPLPELFKSIVVLDITIDSSGRLAQVAVRRSNGFRQLENRAMDSVREAAPYAARGGAGSVRFLETFLFRDDGRFQIRSLVEGA